MLWGCQTRIIFQKTHQNEGVQTSTLLYRRWLILPTNLSLVFWNCPQNQFTSFYFFDSHNSSQFTIALIFSITPSLDSKRIGPPGCLSQLSTWLWLRSWSCGSWVRAPCQALCWQLWAWSLLHILCLPLSLLLPLSHSVSLCLSKINKC